MNFPGITLGVLFSIVEITSGAVTFLANPIVEITILSSSLATFYKIINSCTIGILVTIILLIAIGTSLILIVKFKYSLIF